jgi:hypothetical protein
MPTLEFHGFDSTAQPQAIQRVRACLAEAPFRGDLVFVTSPPSEVLDWSGAARPFIRVLTRIQDRADWIRTRLVPHFDVEVVRIEFHARAS